MAVNQFLGWIDCPHCGKEVALKESKKGKSYYTCDDCGQFFSRTAGADEMLRSKIRSQKRPASAETKEEVKDNAAENSERRETILDRIFN